MKKLIVCTMALCILLSGCGSTAPVSSAAGSDVSTMEPESEPEPTASSEEEPVEEEEPAEEEPAESAEEEGAASSGELFTDAERALAIVALSLKMAYADKLDYYEVTTDTDPNILTFNVANDGLAEGAEVLKQNGDTETIEDTKDAMIELNGAISEMLEDAGLSDATVVVNLLNDTDHEKVLLTVVDGAVVFDALS